MSIRTAILSLFIHTSEIYTIHILYIYNTHYVGSFAYLYLEYNQAGYCIRKGIEVGEDHERTEGAEKSMYGIWKFRIDSTKSTVYFR